MSRGLRLFLLASTSLAPLCAPSADANPLGGQVVGGSASISGQGGANVTVIQTTPSAIINWREFNIGAGETTRFVQPNTSSVILDRVTGGGGPSTLNGNLLSNGAVYLVNPDGILIGPTGRIQTGSFLATTHDIANSDFMAGRYQFSLPGHPDASIVNQGAITATTGGFAALVAPGVRNDGIITARLGKVALAAGNGFSLDFYGDQLITLGVNDSIAAQVKDVSSGKPLASLVSNTGTIKANGGTVQMTAVAARRVLDSVINNTGVVQANSIGRHNGMIVLGAATGASKPAGAPQQLVKVSGRLSAAGKRRQTKGGTIVVTGEAIQIAHAQIDASGLSGGGHVLIGGDWSGGHPILGSISNASAALESFSIPNATTVSVNASSTIDASAKATGNGGKVIVWADQATTFDGNITARGGVNSGDGGFVETSGKQALAIQTGSVDTSAPNGNIGDWLLDPANIIVSQGGTATLSMVNTVGVSPGVNVFISPSTIGSSFTNVMLQATSSILFDAPVTMLHDHVGITAEAGQSIVVESGASITTRGGNVDLYANWPFGSTQLNGSIGISGPISTNGGGLTGGVVILYVAGGTGAISFFPSAGGIVTSGGSVILEGPVDLLGTDALTNTLLTIDTTGNGSFSSGAMINFMSPLYSYYFGRQRLTLAAGGSDINFGDYVSIGGLTIASARNVTAASYITANNFFTDTAQTGNLTIPGGISTSGYEGSDYPQAGNQNAGPINISANGNVNIGTDANSFVIAFGGYVAATGAAGNGANVTIRAGGTLTLSGVAANGGTPYNGATLGGNAGNISLTAPTISLLGYPSATFDGVPNLYQIAIGAEGGPNSSTVPFLPQYITGQGGNIALNGNVVLRGGPGTTVLIDNDSSGPSTNVTITGQTNATTQGSESLFLEDGHGQVSAGNIGATMSLNTLSIADDLTGTFGSVSAASLARYFSTLIPSPGATTTSFAGPVNISGDASLSGANLLFASSLSVGGNATLGSANLKASSVSIGGSTTISGNTTINTSGSNGSITLGAIDGMSPLTQSLTLLTGQGQFTHGGIGKNVPLEACTLNGVSCFIQSLLENPTVDQTTASIFSTPAGGIQFSPVTGAQAPTSLTSLAKTYASAILEAAQNPTNALNYLTEPQIESIVAMVFGSLISRLAPSAAQEFEQEVTQAIIQSIGTLDDPVTLRAAALIPLNITLSNIANKWFVDPTSDLINSQYGSIYGGIDKYSDQVVANGAIAYIDLLILTAGTPAFAQLVNPENTPEIIEAAGSAGIITSTITDVFQLLEQPTPVY